MDDVVLGPGLLAGTGVYAARDFARGEVVVAFELRSLTEAEYLSLPDGEHLFVHSYFGRRYLYPPPARFVNHADDPSCVPDFDRAANVARRPIAAGEPITIDAMDETRHELATFLTALAHADVTDLVDPAAVIWRDGRAQGPAAVVTSLTALDWRLRTGRWEALCSADSPHGHVTTLLKIVRGNWRLLYQHIG